MDNFSRFEIFIETHKKRKRFVHKIKEKFKKPIFDNKNKSFHLKLE